MKTETNFDQSPASDDAAEIRAHAKDLKEFSSRLRGLSPYARKLLLHIAELAYHGRGEQRKSDVAYLPELYECTGLGVEAMYPLLEGLKQGKFIDVQDQYPFEDVKIASASSGVNVLRTITRFCEQKKIPLRDILVDLHFELLNG
jgi:hypothetical protein